MGGVCPWKAYLTLYLHWSAFMKSYSLHIQAFQLLIHSLYCHQLPLHCYADNEASLESNVWPADHSRAMNVLC